MSGFDGGARFFGATFCAQCHFVEFFALEANQAGIKALPLMLHLCGDRPIFLRPECFDFAITFDDQAQRHRLHAPGRFRPREFAPQHRRQGEADKVIERTAGAIGIDQVMIEFARMGHRLGNRLFGDCIEGDACDILGQCLFLLQHFLHMPADCFPLAIRVGCEDQAIGLLCLVCDGFQLLGLVWVIVPQHGEAVFGIN